MTEHDARPDEIDPASSEPVAPDHVQDDISAMLRETARIDDGSTRMPAGVTSDILTALRSEGWSGSTTSTATEAPSPQAPRTVIPLPAARRATSTPTSAPTSKQADVPVPVVADESPAASRMSADHADGASVVSLTDHRDRKRPKGRMLLGLGAAAAVVVGAAGVWSHHDSGTSGHGTLAASQVRTTNSATRYEKSSFKAQTASLVTTTKAPRITTPAEAQKAGLPAVPTAQQVSACVNSLAKFLDSRTGRIYADVGTYEGKKALIVVAVQGRTRQAWALNPAALQNSCTDRTDVLTTTSVLQA